MKNKILVIAPHPDDETLGCGGTLLKHLESGDSLYWTLVTSMTEEAGYKKNIIKTREKEIKKIKKIYKFKKLFKLDFMPSKIDSLPLLEVIKPLVDVVNEVKPNILYLPFYGDAHTDHQVTFKAASSLIKWFRYPFIKKVIIYETLSETNFNFSTKHNFRPNMYVNISKFLEKKIKIFKTYKSEVKKHPFPRSEEAIRASAILRGSESGFKYAEAFKSILNRVD